MAKPKHIIQEGFDKNKINLNFRDQKYEADLSVSPTKKQQPVQARPSNNQQQQMMAMAYNANNRMNINNNPYVLNKNEGSNSTKNLYQNLPHKNDLASLGINIVGGSNNSAVMSKKQDLSNLK
jgi:hypothetical protein